MHILFVCEKSGNERLPKRSGSVMLVVYSHDAGWIPNFNAKLCQTVSHNAAKCLRATESATLNVTAKVTIRSIQRLFAKVKRCIFFHAKRRHSLSTGKPAFTLPNQQHVAFVAHGGFRYCHIKQQLPTYMHILLYSYSIRTAWPFHMQCIHLCNRVVFGNEPSHWHAFHI
ncbi:hypothetical protein GQX74_003858, partial [Glossina fuscipes]